ncbi:alginate lyase family protein [Anaerorhabdus sp.]|uniref:alginate lyase family protein n=1 Tax=Anaerorhabdus sp. TaxID=1872524 RepID=UPI002FCBA245
MYNELKPLLTKQEENKKIIMYANQIVEHQFSFDKTWDMERCTTIYELPKIIDWNQIYNDDEEWVFMLNRFSYLKDLSLAYLITSATIYPDKIKDLMMQWIDKHPTMEYSLSTRTLDTAIRLEMFETMIQFLKEFNLLSDVEEKKIKTSIVSQIQYLRDNYITKYRLSNWGSIQLLTLNHLIPELDENYTENSIHQWALKESKEQLHIQVLKDGMHWEQSTMYHVEVLNNLLTMIQKNRTQQIEIEYSYIDTAMKMVDALFGLTLPQGVIETFGDSDRTMTKDVFIKACSILNTNKWKKEEWDIDADTLFDLGLDLALRFKSFEVNHNTPVLFDGHDAGIYVVKNSTKPNASSTMFINGSLGSGHGHSDNLHLSLSLNGIPFLIDSGRYTYREDHKERIRLKSMEAHNIVLVDDLPHSIPDGSWTNESFCRPLKTFVNHSDEVHYYESGILCLDKGYTVLRKLVVLDINIWLLVDEVIYAGKHHTKTFYHLDPDVSVDQNYLLSSHDEYLQMNINGDTSIKESVCSLRYNELSKQKVIEVTHQFENHLINLTDFYQKGIKVEDVFIQQGDKICNDHSLYCAKKYIVNEDETVVVILFHKEIYKGSKIFSYEGCSFHAQSLVIKTKAGVKEVHVLK